MTTIKKTWYVYILECGGGRLYTGVTNDLERRLAAHRAGRGARFTRAFGVRCVLYTERRPSHGEALSREAEIKGWTRSEKLLLIRSKAKRRKPSRPERDDPQRKSRRTVRIQVQSSRRIPPPKGRS